jgi:uncharacterized membrane protein SpoIIM required for sporulation
MIVDLKAFLAKEQPSWHELERALDALDAKTLDLGRLEESQRLLLLFERACSDLARMGEGTSEPQTRAYLEALVARGYAEIHSGSGGGRPIRLWRWLMVEFPRAFRRHAWAFGCSALLTVLGMLVGAILLVVSPEGRRVATAPFAHVALQSPSERVASEEKDVGHHRKALEGSASRFSAQLMKNNISVSIKAAAFGMTWGVGTALLLFYNGVILGAVCLDYVLDGQSVFLAAWLLPHGSFEIPAILMGGQVGLVLAGALVGWGTCEGLRTRLRAVVPDVATLVGGLSLMLVWAGLVEAFFSQYHAPVIPYSVKIVFGGIECVLLVAFLAWSGRQKRDREEQG